MADLARAGTPVEPEADLARRTMIGRSAEEVDHAPPRGRYAPDAAAPGAAPRPRPRCGGPPRWPPPPRRRRGGRSPPAAPPPIAPPPHRAARPRDRASGRRRPLLPVSGRDLAGGGDTGSISSTVTTSATIRPIGAAYGWSRRRGTAAAPGQRRPDRLPARRRHWNCCGRASGSAASRWCPGAAGSGTGRFRDGAHRPPAAPQRPAARHPRHRPRRRLAHRPHEHRRGRPHVRPRRPVAVRRPGHPGRRAADGRA